MRPSPTILVRSLIEWFEHNARDLPWRRTTDPYAIWISEIMLQQTQVKTVVPYWKRWMRRFPNVRALASASLDEVLKQWEGLGYYTRAHHLHRAANRIQQDHRGRFPTRSSDLQNLPGIGRYTAGAICSIAFDQPAPILDGNVLRVLSRLFGIKSEARSAATQTLLWKRAEALVFAAAKIPSHSRACSKLNQGLMELGAVLCTPRLPDCPSCPIQSHCYAHQHNCVARFPNLGNRARASKRHFFALAIQHRGRWLIRQRPEKGVNAHLWEFPNCEVENVPSPNLGACAAQCAGFPLGDLKPLCTIWHTITRYRIQLEVFAAKLNGRLRPQDAIGSWRRLSELDQLPFPNAHRQIVHYLKERTP